MIRWDADGSRNRRLMTPTSEVFFGRSISAQCQSAYHDMAVEQRTVDVCGAIQIYPQDASCGEGQNKHIVGDGSSDKVGGDGELQRHALNVEHGQRGIAVLEVARAGRRIPARYIVRHGGCYRSPSLMLCCTWHVLRPAQGGPVWGAGAVRELSLRRCGDA